MLKYKNNLKTFNKNYIKVGIKTTKGQRAKNVSYEKNVIFQNWADHT